MHQTIETPDDMFEHGEKVFAAIVIALFALIVGSVIVISIVYPPNNEYTPQTSFYMDTIDGRTIPCVVHRNTSISCDWGSR